MKQRAERLAVHPFLGKRVDGQTLDPDSPVTLEPRPPPLKPAPPPTLQLPPKPAEADQDHGEENHLHPRRDVTEDLTRGVIQVDCDHGSSRLSLLQQLD